MFTFALFTFAFSNSQPNTIFNSAYKIKIFEQQHIFEYSKTRNTVLFSAKSVISKNKVFDQEPKGRGPATSSQILESLPI